MKTQAIGLTIAALIGTFAHSSYGQFDLGRAINDGLRGEIQQIKGEIQGAIKGGIQQGLPHIQPPHNGGGNHILPYPLPYPVPTEPPITVHPRPTCPPVRPPITTLPYPYPQPISPPGGSGTIRPIVEPPPEKHLPVVASGQLVAIDGKHYGDEVGAVFVTIDKTILNAEITEWSDVAVSARMPRLPLVESIEATVVVVSAAEEVVQRMDIQLDPPSEETEPVATDEGTSSEVDTTLPEVESNSELTLEGESLGAEAGRARVAIGALQLDAAIVSWNDSEATIQVPELHLVDSTNGQIHLFDANGNQVSELHVTFTPSISLAADR